MSSGTGLPPAYSSAPGGSNYRDDRDDDAFQLPPPHGTSISIQSGSVVGGDQHPPGSGSLTTGAFARGDDFLSSDPYPRSVVSASAAPSRIGSLYDGGSVGNRLSIMPDDSVSNWGGDDSSSTVHQRQQQPSERLSQIGLAMREKEDEPSGLYPYTDSYHALYKSDSNQPEGSTSYLPLVANGEHPSSPYDHNRPSMDSQATLGVLPYRDGASGHGTKMSGGSSSGLGVRDRGLDEDLESFKDTRYPPAPVGFEGYPTSEREQKELGNGRPYTRPNVFMRMLRDNSPLEQRIQEYQRGIGVQNRAWACWILSIGMLIAFIVELVNNQKAQGSIISTKPVFNPMIGPSAAVLINSGARFVPCMKEVQAIPPTTPFACLNDTTGTSTTTCSLAEICGFGGFGPSGVPNQTFRFVLPMFLHAGIIHIILNLLAQMTSSGQVERQMGALRFLPVYVASGIFGFVLGGNFALVGIPSVGASGAIFGTNATVLVDLLAHWKLERQPIRKLIFLIIELVIGLAIGFIPFAIDNFSHIGGFLMGILTSIILLPVIHQTKRHRIIFYVLRIIALPLVIVLFVVLVRNFYVSDSNKACEWCRFLSCWPSAANNQCQGTGLTTTSSSSLLDGGLVAALVKLVLETYFL